jgi:8-oxo-dGTP pyrophosphatase MutT (NUDIX family)
MTGEPQPRTGARILLLDPDGQVLLIHERIEGGDHWLTPGGGVEGDESLAIAAARELYEETSIRVEIDPDEPPVHRLVRVWHWRGASYRQTDNFFVVRLGARPEVVPAAPTAMEQETLLGFRWWPIEELSANTTEVIEPPDLADLLQRLELPVPPAA